VVNLLEPSGNAGHDHQAIIGLDRCIQILQVTDIFAVQVEIDKGAQVFLAVEEVLAEVGVLLHQAIHSFRDGAASDFDDGLAV
jgi:hypothetical protein